MNASTMEPTCPSCAHLQAQIDTLERNVIEEFRALAQYQHDRSLAPLIHRLNALESLIAQPATVLKED